MKGPSEENKSTNQHVGWCMKQCAGMSVYRFGTSDMFLTNAGCVFCTLAACTHMLVRHFSHAPHLCAPILHAAHSFTHNPECPLHFRPGDGQFTAERK